MNISSLTISLCYLYTLAMATNGLSVHKSEEEWRAILSPEQFHILRDKGTESVSYFTHVLCLVIISRLFFMQNNCANVFVFTGLAALATMTSFMMRGCTIVLVAEHLFTNLEPSSALAVAGLLSLKASLEPLTAL